jgi:transcriptional regulator with XRE-family HTH domain
MRKGKTRSGGSRAANHVGRLVRKLRDSRGLTQGDLGRLLGVGRTAVSAWEKGDNVPRGPAALRIAALMPDENAAATFLALVGVDQESMAGIVHDIGSKKPAATKPFEMVEILPAQESAGAAQLLKGPLTLDAEVAGDPRSKRYFVAPQHASTLGFEPQDILLLEALAPSAGVPPALWDKRVLVEYRARREAPYYPELTYEVGRLILAHYPGDKRFFYVAELHLWSDAPPRPPAFPGLQIASRTIAKKLLESGDKAGARRALLMEPSPTPENLGFRSPTWLGTWSPRKSTRGASRPASAGADPAEIQRARESLKLHEGIRILGRVVGWLEPQGLENEEA